jgi:hypothetical protein
MGATRDAIPELKAVIVGLKNMVRFWCKDD